MTKTLKGKTWPLLENSAVKPVIHSAFAAAHAAQAYGLMASKQHIAPTVLPCDAL